VNLPGCAYRRPTYTTGRCLMRDTCGSSGSLPALIDNHGFCVGLLA
jgi:hypothetical protein